MNKFKVIAPINSINFDFKKLIKDIESFIKGNGYELEVYFIIGSNFEGSANYTSNKKYNLIKTQTSNVNELIKIGFEQFEKGNVLIANFNEPNWQSLLMQIINKATAGNIVLSKSLKQKSRFKNALKKLFSKIYLFYLKFFNLEKDLFTFNYFSYFNKNAVEVIKSIPHKNAYLRNFDVWVGYDLQIIKIKSDQPNIFIDLKTKVKSMLMGIGLIFLSLILLAITISFNDKILALNNGFTYYLVGLILFACLMFFGGYFIFKEVVSVRGNLKVAKN